ncbi:MAG: alpha/beta fold hydrolase [Spirochaetia bacterium]
MDLAFRDLGGRGPSIAFLHGLFGSSQNWVGMGRRLSGLGRCLLVDLRNHGDSPHTAEHSLAACVQDIADWARTHAPGPLTLVGHSMGGLVAMGFAVAHPDRTRAIASLDIAPRPYPPEHEAEFRALHVDISRCRSRAELDSLLADVLPDPGVRQFILTNAVRDGRGFRWRLNVPALESSTLSGDFAAVEGRYDGPALLVAGGKSRYVTRDDLPVMRRHFPAAVFETIPQADHWLHVSAPEVLADVLGSFLRGFAPDAIKGRVSRP